MDTVLFQLVLVVHGIVAVPGKAVELPDQNHIENFLCAVLNHPLEVRAVIRLGRVGTVDVGADHGDTVLLGVVLAVAQLPFNGRFALAVRRIAGVDHGGHGCTSLAVCPACSYRIESSAACQQSASRLKNEISEIRENVESKNRPVATNFQFLKILAPLGQLLVGACLPQTLLGTSTANWN